MSILSRFLAIDKNVQRADKQTQHETYRLMIKQAVKQITRKRLNKQTDNISVPKTK